jgi:uncharacterized OB-fold protein
MSDTEYAKPLPEPSIDSQPFWDNLKNGRLTFQTCANCGQVRHYPRPVCEACYSMESDWTEASGKGTLYSWTETHHPFHVAFRGETPYILATVDMAEGVRIQSLLLGASVGELALGLPVETVLHRATEDVTLPLFRLAR